jgi:hypothetical protein
MAQFQGQEPNGSTVQQLEVLVRTALFKPATALGGFLLQGAADRIDAAYQPPPGQARKGRETRPVQGLFGSFPLARDYYHHADKQPGHYPARQVVLLIAGAEGLARMGQLCFPTALPIVDFYHALEHAGQVLVALLGNTEHPDYKKRLGRWARRLLHDQVESLIAQGRRECAGQARAQAVEKELGCFLNNAERMQYGTFRRQGFFSGSGVIEAGCKTVIGARCKQSGMFWGEPGAENVLALRCIQNSRRLAEFWKDRLNIHAARNDPLALAA